MGEIEINKIKGYLIPTNLIWWGQGFEPNILLTKDV